MISRNILLCWMLGFHEYNEEIISEDPNYERAEAALDRFEKDVLEERSSQPMRIRLDVSPDGRVFLRMHDTGLSASLWLTAEEAQEIGAVGNMAAMKKKFTEEKKES